MLPTLASHLRYAVIAIIAIIGIIFLSNCTGRARLAQAQAAAVCTYAQAKPALHPLDPADIKSVVDEAGMANEAARTQTNSSSLDALVEVTSALASLNTVTLLAGREPVTYAAGGPVWTLQQELAAHQRQLLVQLYTQPAAVTNTAYHPPLPTV